MDANQMLQGRYLNAAGALPVSGESPRPWLCPSCQGRYPARGRADQLCAVRRSGGRDGAEDLMGRSTMSGDRRAQAEQALRDLAGGVREETETAAVARVLERLATSDADGSLRALLLEVGARSLICGDRAAEAVRAIAAGECPSPLTTRESALRSPLRVDRA